MIGAYPLGTMPIASRVGRLDTKTTSITVDATATTAIDVTRIPGFGMDVTATVTTSITLRKMWDGEAANSETWWDNRADATTWADAAANAETWSDA